MKNKNKMNSVNEELSLDESDSKSYDEFNKEDEDYLSFFNYFRFDII